MGSLSGHILPGSFFLLFGFWWCWSIFNKYFLFQKEKKKETLTRNRRRNSRYVNTVSFPCLFCKKIPVEAVIKINVALIGIVGEFITAYKNGVFTHYGNVQHMSMYLFFGINGVVEVIDSLGCGLLPDLDFISGILAFIIEGILFYFHLDGSKPMEYRLHILLVLLVFGTVVSSIFEMMFRESVCAALSRSYFVFLQGTWFYQVGFVLYVYNWKDATSNQMKIVTYIYAWHFAAVFIFFLLLGFFIRWKVFKCDKSANYRTLYPIQSSSKFDETQSEINIEMSSSEEL